MKTRLILPAFAVLAALGACNGWPRAAEYKEAENRPEKYPTYAAAPATSTQTFVFENRKYMVTAAPVDLHGAKLHAVGMTGDIGVFAPEGAQTPYTVLYAPAGGNKYRRIVPIE